MLYVTNYKYISDYIIWLEFSDGTSGTIDLLPYLIGPIFEPLKDKNNFNKVILDPELQTIAWPNGADFAPEFLKERVSDQ